jgi:hypothetical protein
MAMKNDKNRNCNSEELLAIVNKVKENKLKLFEQCFPFGHF